MNFLSGFEHIVREHESLAAYTTLGLGGPARYLIEPTSEAELIAAVRACSGAGVPMRVIGGGSNILVREGGFDGAVFSLSAPAFTTMSTEGDVVRCGCGARLANFISFCVGSKLGGLEHLVGIPGTVGGALHGNAGTLNGDIGSLVIRARLLTSDAAVVVVDRDAMDFGTRRSSLDELAILDASFRLRPGDAATLTKRMQTLWIVKRSGQPDQSTRTAPAFIDPDPGAASDLIAECSMAGYREGNVLISPAYPNYVVVDGPATSDDVIRVLAAVGRRVEERTGVQLQLHPRIW